MSRRLYDPDPRRRTRRGTHRRRSPRKGIEPAGLRRWRLAHRRTADPGYARTVRQGPRGGWFFAGPKKRRYDPAPRRFARARAFVGRHPRARRIAGKIEGGINKYGTYLGMLFGALAGILVGYDEYKATGPNQFSNYLHATIGGDIKNADGTVARKAVAEISHLWNLDMKDPWNAVNYLKYKFLGLEPNSNKYVGSAWVIPFWVGIGSFIFSKLPLGSRLHRIQRPLGKIGLGVAGVSAFGALALPGSPNMNNGYGNIPSASPGYNEPVRPALPAPIDQRYHNI
jgi:hypothetical protein